MTTTIGRYVVQRELGRGSMGVVYVAEDPAIGRLVAIKTIHLSALSDSSERERLRDRLVREAQSAGILSHPGIVTIYDISHQGDLAYVFMEYVNGPPLEKVLAGPNPPDKGAILEIIRQAGAALDYAHRKGIVHRDIKPANILMAEDGAAKITDFGVAKIVSQQMTAAGTLMGTPSYMSPEQVQGVAVDGRCDQFSLAVIAYEMMTSERPFVADSLPTLLFKIVREEPVPPQRINPTLSSKIESVLSRGLAKDPNARYPTCSEFAAALTLAANATSKWKPMPRGVSQTMATVAGSDPSPLAAPPPAPPAVATLERHRRRLEREVGRESRLGRYIIGLLAFLAIAVGGIVAVSAWRAGQASKVASQAQVEKVDEPAPPAPKPEPPPEPRPSPSGERVETPESPPETAPEPPPPQTTPTNVPRQSPPVAREFGVEVITAPPGAKIIVDDDPKNSCESPCNMTLSTGRHVLVASMDGYRRWPRIFEVPQETSLFLKLEKMTGQIAVRTQPAGATIFVDGKEQHQKSPAIITLPVGKYQIAVAKEGFRRSEETIQVRDGALSQLEFNWSQATQK